MDFNYFDNLDVLSDMLDKATKQFNKDVKLFKGDLTEEERAQIKEMDRVVKQANDTTAEVRRKANKRK
jgi:hypothetical protein